MPIEFPKPKYGVIGWFWTVRPPNGEIIGFGADGYTSKAKAVQGAKAAAAEFAKWLKEQKPKTPKAQTSGRPKPAAKPSTSSSNQTRKTVKRGG